MRYTKSRILAIILALAMLTLAACSSRDDHTSIASSPSSSVDVVSSEHATVPESTANASVEPESASNLQEPASGFIRASFQAESATKTISYTLDLPENWTVESYGAQEGDSFIFMAEGFVPSASTDEFAYFDEVYKNATSTAILEVSGYPAKLYELTFEKSGNGDMEAGKQYLYFLKIVDEYLLLFFTPMPTSTSGKEVFDTVVDSFKIEIDSSKTDELIAKEPQETEERVEITSNPTYVDFEGEDFFIFEGVVYLNASDIDWVKELEIAEGELLGEIKPLGITNSYADWEASVLPVGTKIYRCADDPTVLTAIIGDVRIPYLKMVEG